MSIYPIGLQEVPLWLCAAGGGQAETTSSKIAPELVWRTQRFQSTDLQRCLKTQMPLFLVRLCISFGGLSTSHTSISCPAPRAETVMLSRKQGPLPWGNWDIYGWRFPEWEVSRTRSHAHFLTFLPQQVEERGDRTLFPEMLGSGTCKLASRCENACAHAQGCPDFQGMLPGDPAKGSMVTFPLIHPHSCYDKELAIWETQQEKPLHSHGLGDALPLLLHHHSCSSLVVGEGTVLPKG